MIDLEKMSQEIANQNGFDEIQRMNVLEGLKMAFTAGFNSYKKSDYILSSVSVTLNNIKYIHISKGEFLCIYL